MRESTSSPETINEDLITGGRLANCLCTTTVKPINDGCKTFYHNFNLHHYITLDGATVQYTLLLGFLQGA
jgi:hypothetical protein